MNISISDAMWQAVQDLAAHGISEARPDAEVLLAHVLALPRPSLYLEARRLLTDAQYEHYTAHITRRLRGEPVQYITGSQEFWSLEFVVTPEVLIPRPESELLVEHGVHLIEQWCATQRLSCPQLLDVGTGSGNLAISLAHTLPYSRVWGIDIARRALRVAQHNADRLGVAAQVGWVCGDLVAPLRPSVPRFALCVANLPYVTTAEWHQLPREIRDYEPTHALIGGRDGLELIRRLVATSPAVLASGGTLLLEVGWKQASTVVKIIQQLGQFQAVGVFRDLAAIERVVWARMP
jgi:release factor glutamine methyltransferase